MTTTNPTNALPPAQQPPPGPSAAALSTALAQTVEHDGTLSIYSGERAFATGQRIAKSLCESSLVPEAYRGNIANCMIALELAGRTGASVIMVMQNLDVIHGRPSFRAQFLIATVNTGGRFTPLRFRFEGKPGSDEWGCRAVAKDKATGEECLGTLVNIAMAKAEGWQAKNGSKWRTLPELMLQYRAATFWTRVYAPELSLGMQTAEEVIDTVGYPVLDDAPASPERGLVAPPQAAPARDFAAEFEDIKKEIAKYAPTDRDGRAALRAAIQAFTNAGGPKPLADDLKSAYTAAGKAAAQGPAAEVPPTTPAPPLDDGPPPDDDELRGRL